MNDPDTDLVNEFKHGRHLTDELDHRPFATVWRAAQQTVVASRRRYRMFMAAAVLVAAAVISVSMQVPSPAVPVYIEVAELLDSTNWVAPSDVLLPDRQFDIYQEIPVLHQPTEPARGALL